MLLVVLAPLARAGPPSPAGPTFGIGLFLGGGWESYVPLWNPTDVSIPVSLRAVSNDIVAEPLMEPQILEFP